MATLYDYLLPISTDVTGWQIGGGSSTEEEAVTPFTAPATSNDDATYVYTENEDDPIPFEPMNTVALPSGATITSVDVIIRAKYGVTEADASIDVQLYDGADLSAAQNTGGLTGTYAEYTLNFPVAPDGVSAWTKAGLDALTDIIITSKWNLGKISYDWYVSSVYLRVSFSLTGSNPTDDNLVLQCKCDDNADSSTVTDSSDSGIAGTMVNDENNYTSEQFDGVNQFTGSGCFDLDGTNDYFYFANSGYLNFSSGGSGNKFSVVIGIYPDTLASNQGLIGKAAGPSDLEWMLLTNDVANSVGRVNFRFGDPSDGTFEGNKLTRLRVLKGGQWNLIIGTYDAGEIHIYINGNEVSHQDGAATPPSSLWQDTDTLKIGTSILSGVASFNGKKDQIQIFNDVLTPEEALFLWNGGDGYEFGEVSQSVIPLIMHHRKMLGVS